MADASPKLGILAGSGPLPARLAEAARDAGREVFVLAIAGEADLAALVPYEHDVVDLAAVGRALDALRAAGCVELVMAGPVRRPDFARLRPDWRGLKLLPKVAAAARGGDNALFSVLVSAFEAEGFRVIGADEVIGGLLAPMGQLGRVAPTPAHQADISRAFEVAKALGALDVGQGAVVVDGVVLGVESVEGTDALLARCGPLRARFGGPGPAGVLVKVAKPGQERRVDLPTIGTRTVAAAAAAGLAGIAVEAGHALVVDRDATVAAADAAGLFLVGVGSGDGG